MKAAILLYTYAGNSFRGAERAMEVFNFVFPFLGLDIPSHVTIREWVLKAGLAELCREKKAIEDYAIIVDESITIAEHKVLMTLAVPAQQGGHPLACSDADRETGRDKQQNQNNEETSIWIQRREVL